MKGVLHCLAHTSQDSSRPYVDTTIPMYFDSEMKKDRMEHLSESWIVAIVAGMNSS